MICDEAHLARIMALGGVDVPGCTIVSSGASGEAVLGLSELLDRAGRLTDDVTIGSDGALIQIFTSGTTGKPKGVIVPLRAMAAFHIYGEFALALRPDDIYWNAADPGWAYGLYYGVIVSLAMGVESVWLDAPFSVELMFSVMAEQRVTNLAAAPTVYRSLRQALPPAMPLAVRRLSSAGELLNADINRWATECFGSEIHDHYGQTETGMMINNHHHPACRQPMKPGSMGRAMPGWRMAVLAEESDDPVMPGVTGRVAADLVASPLGFFGGYEGEPERSREKFSGDGRWYITGDLGMVDADGDFFFASRDDDVILMAGYRIGPAEIETVLMTHPAVADAPVIAASNALRGEVLECFVVLAAGNGADPALAKDLQAWVKQRYGAHAYPRTVHFAEQIPRTASGKLQRYILRQQRRDAAA